jgi:LmbE family N-acetylglucosaminyl deacetylase/SAM-dependent methyltransferase
LVIFDRTAEGADPALWESADPTGSLPRLDFAAIQKLTVIAAHPDDETLGAGGLIADCVSRGIPVRIVVVTDGAASHERSSAIMPSRLAVVRQRELFAAVGELGPESEVIMLGFADGKTDEVRDQILEALRLAIEPGATVASPWRGDGHRDHRIVGEICAALAAEAKATLLEYPIWMWHWARPGDNRVPWGSAVAAELTTPARAAKRRAIGLHVSQVVGVGSGERDGPVLSPEFLANFTYGRELFFANVNEVAAKSKPQAYFDELYAQRDDPWRLRTRWYERRKRAITVASLPRERYASALEIGCSTGELTASLAPRCESLLAIDISAAAVAHARERTAGHPQLRVELQDATVRFPDGPFDLVVLSEVGYYWDEATLRHVTADIRRHLTADATVLVCHWRHPVADYPLGGDETQDIVRESLALGRVATHDEADFLIEVYSTVARSVAEIEGLLD